MIVGAQRHEMEDLEDFACEEVRALPFHQGTAPCCPLVHHPEKWVDLPS